jgi:IS5 family transposase
MSYGRMAERATELEAEVAGWLSAAEAADTEEDKLYGRDKTGEELPDWVADKQRRAEKIRQAKAELEAEAKAAAEAELKERAAAEAKREAEGRRQGGRKAALPSPTPDAKAQKNFTDPESRIMKSKDGFVQAYNAQIAVDAEAQIIVAQDVTQSASDCAQLLPMTDAVEANLGRKPEQASADAGYCSEENLAGLEARSIDGYVATGRARDAVAGTAKDEAARAPSSTQPAETPTRVEAMRAKIKAGGHATPYRLRKQLPEPVFGQIKQARGFRQFLLRGFEKVSAEWALVCTAHNLLKLANGRILSVALRSAVAAG